MDDDAEEARGAGALVVNDAGEYLLHLRDDIPGICDPGAWSLIGGNRDSGETSEETIRRELKEEAGLDLPDLVRFTVAESVGHDGLAKGRVQVFRAVWNGDAAALPVGEGIMFHWFAPDVVPRLRMSGWARAAIARDQGREPDEGG
ncbi:NUDIX domain-containing protein [Actinocorallia herbida]|uniref:NUDIX domain-containing protein n=1 Tax=Actinocorallia herbida TaxID=58109 RepID=A0A3N1CXG7_9ACTN|nr:NUDIX hydrolase [Actinocorallia herbida]ROO85418.1 NUDIX domain-containing protein [Actinocorallia herbida]